MKLELKNDKFLEVKFWSWVKWQFLAHMIIQATIFMVVFVVAFLIIIAE